MCVCIGFELPVCEEAVLDETEYGSSEEYSDTGIAQSRFSRWGFCEICNVPLNSEVQAVEHIHGSQHLENEAKKTRSTDLDRKPAHLFMDGKRIGKQDNEREPTMSRQRRASSSDEKTIWIIGGGEMKEFVDDTTRHGTLRDTFRMYEFSFVWHCARCLQLREVIPAAENLLEKGPAPSHIVLHVGGYELGVLSRTELIEEGTRVVETIQRLVPNAVIIWNQLLPRWTGYKDSFTLNKDRREVDDELASLVLEKGGSYIRFTAIELRYRNLFEESRDGDLSLSRDGLELMGSIFTGGVRSIVLRDMKIVPDMKDLGGLCSCFVRNHILPNINKKRRLVRKF